MQLLDYLHDVGYIPRQIKGPIGLQRLRELVIDRFSKAHRAEYFQTIQGNLALMIIIEGIIFCQQLIFIDRMLFYKNGYGQLLKELFADNLTQEKNILNNQIVIMFSYMAFLIAKNLLMLGILFWRPKSSVWAFMKNVLYQIHMIEFSIGVVPIVLLICTNLNPSKTVVGILPAIISIAVLTWQRLFMRIFERQYHFTKTKLDLFDGSSWTPEVRILADFISMIVREATSQASSRNLVLTSVFLLMQVIVIGFMVSRQFYYISNPYVQVYLSRVSLLVTMAIYLFLSSLSETIYGIVNLEVLLFSVFILITRVARNLYFRVREKIAQEDIYSLKTAYEVEIKTNHLLGLYSGLIEKDQTSVELQQQMAGHIRGCKDPKCFCRIILGKFNSNWYKTFDQKKALEIGFRKKLQYVSNLEKIIFLENKRVVEQALSEQADMDVDIEKKTHREYQRKEIVLLKKDIRNQETLQKKIDLINNSNPDRIVDVVDVGSFHFKAVIYSFLVGMTERLKSFDSSYLLFSYCHFTLKNYAMVLLKGYTLLHSEDFQKQGGILDLITLTNYLTMSSTELREDSLATKKWLTEADFGHIFIGLKKIDYLTYQIKELIQIKVQLLSHLINKDKELKSIVELGEKAFLKTAFCTKYCDELLSTFQNNKKLVATAINYKVNVAQEWQGITKLKETYLRLQKKSKLVFDGEQLKGKKNINLIDSDSITMSHSIKLTGIFITYFSKNAPAQLKIRPDKLNGMNIKEIMPQRLNQVHDQKVFDYINRRNQRDLTPIAVHGCVIDGSGNIQLYTVIAKIDVMINDGIYFMSLMTNTAPSKKAKYILFDQGIEPTGFTESVKADFPDITGKPSKIYNHLPLLIEVARTNLVKINRQSSNSDLNQDKFEDLARITKVVLQSIVLETKNDEPWNDQTVSKNSGSKLFIEPQKDEKRFIKLTQKIRLEPPVEKKKASYESLNKVADTGQSVAKLREELVKWLEANQGQLAETADEQRECNITFSLHKYQDNDYYYVAELKNFRKIESKEFLHMIKQMLKKQMKEHLVNILLVESGLLKVICT